MLENFKMKNYTTEISAEKSIFEIEQLLNQAGASHIMKEFMGDGRILSIAFRLQEKAYKLPANFEGVNTVLTQGKRMRHIRDAQKTRDERASRVAWRIIKDWLHAQLSLIASGQAAPDEVLLPYMFNGKTTLYQQYKAGQLGIEGEQREMIQ